ncbi:MAG: hypothetical protein MCM46_18205 [Candidatus Manganitrophus sp. SB1]|nr:hypothetical protein [Candidatus Manganitrophus morganii]
MQSRFYRWMLVLLFFSPLVLQNCGGGGSSGGNPAGATVSGTAATGAAVASATITIKDAAGASATATTGADGKYTIDVDGMTAPFLVKVDLPGGTALYSVGGAAGVINIHPLTDMIIQAWYQVQGQTVDAGFNDPVGNPAPTAAILQTIADVVEEIVHQWLIANGLDPAEFDLITTPFDADSTGFDLLLDMTTIADDGTVTITDGTVTQTTTVTFDTSDGSATISTTTTDGTTTSSSVTTTVIPATSAQQAALAGVQSALTQLANTVNSKGDTLAASDLADLFDPGYLEDGDDAEIGAAEFATDFRGITMNAFSVDRIYSYDDTNKVVSIAGVVSFTEDGVTVEESIEDEGGSGLTFRRQSDGSWLLYGNQRIVRVDADIRIENRMDDTCGDCTNPVKVLHLQEEGPVGDISGVTVSGSDGSSYTLTENVLTSTDTLEPTPGNEIDIIRERFDLCPPSCDSLDAFPPAGTVYTFTVTPSDASGDRTYTDMVRANTTETIAITNLTDHSLASVKGQTVTVEWTLPTTFAIANVDLRAFVVAGGSGCDIESDTRLSITATSGTITIPTHCGEGEIVSLEDPEGPVPASISVEVTGVNGQVTNVWFPFR